MCRTARPCCIFSLPCGDLDAFVAVWRDPETKALPVVVGVLLVSGTMFYWSVEDWTLIESLYFSVVTLATVGYGDLTPTGFLANLHDHLHLHWTRGAGPLPKFARAAVHQA